MWTEETPVYSDGGILAFVERDKHEVWYADDTSEVTVTATLPDGSSLSVSGSFAEAGQEVEMGTNFATTVGWTIHRYDYDGVVYAAVDAWQWGDQAVDTSNAELYNPGTDVPDSNNPNWGRTKTQDDCLRVGACSEGLGTWGENHAHGQIDDVSWSGKVWAPLWVHFKPRTGKFADDADYDDLVVEGSPVEWDEETSSFVKVKFTGEKEVIHQRRSWLFEREWRKLSGNIQYLDWNRDAMKARGEDVNGDDSPDVNNQACPLVIHPINVSDLTGEPTGEWPVFLTVAHEPPVRVVKPPGVVRPAQWQGSEGLTPDPADNDLWHVAAGSENPAATLILATRKWARLNRVVWQDPSLPGMMKHRDLLLINRANVDQVAGEYLDPEDERIPENIWHWQNFAYAELRLKAPRDADLELVVTYSTVTASDPCYPTLQSGEFWWDRQQQQVSYKIHIEATPEGQDYSSVVFDLALPAEGEVAPTLYHVDQVTVRILGQAEEDEDWEFDDLYLTGAYWEEAWGDEPDSYFEVREYDPWDFLADYTGFAAVVSGLRCLNVPYGYEEYERTEQSLKQRQKWRSRNKGVNIMDYAKALSRLVTELNWQEGWQAGYGQPEESDANKDDEGNKLIGTFRWWDLLRHHEYKFDQPPRSTSQDLPGAPVVRHWQIVAGIKHVICYEKFAQGRPHGLAYLGDRSGRRRGKGAVQLYVRDFELGEPGEWTLAGNAVPDMHGRWRLGPDLEKNKQYKLGNDDTVFMLANARYNWLSGVHILTAFRPAAEYCGVFAKVFLVHERGPGQFALRQWYLVYLRRGKGEDPWWMNETIEGVGERPALARLYRCARNDLLFWQDGHIYVWEQYSWANRWLNKVDLGEFSQWFAAETSHWGLGLVYREDDGNFYWRSYRRKQRTPLRPPSRIGPGIESEPAVVYVRPTWKWWVAVPTAEGVDLYKSGDDGGTWQLLRSFPGLQHPGVDYTPFGLLVAGLLPVEGQPWDADLVAYSMRFRDAQDRWEPVTIGHADMDRIALVNSQPIQKIYCFASRLSAWAENDEVGLMAYVSRNSGRSWHIEKVFPG